MRTIWRKSSTRACEFSLEGDNVMKSSVQLCLASARQLLPALHQPLQFIRNHVVDHQVKVFHLHHLMAGDDNVDVGHVAGLSTLEPAEANGGCAAPPGFFK